VERCTLAEIGCKADQVRVESCSRRSP
jgi:hypothetical protein